MVFKTLCLALLALSVPSWAQLIPGVCTTLPKSFEPKKNITKLPDPFTFVTTGRRTVNKADWTCRRQEINELFQRFELGTLPPRPQHIASSLENGTLTINATEAGKTISFTVSIQMPANVSETEKVPGFIVFGGLSLPLPSGIATIIFNNNDIALENDQSSRGVGKFFDLYGANHSAGALMAWAWGVSRVIDALEQTPRTASIDLSRLGVTGCSRNGKGALVAGAFEERIALTIPQESGSGGSGCWRISDSMLANGTDTQTASEIVQENVWFSPEFTPWANTSIDPLPFDHHMLSALVAPRAMFSIDNVGNDWLGPESIWGCQSTAHKIWEALGVPDNMGISQAASHVHCSFPSEQTPELDAIVNKFLFGKETNTSILETAATTGVFVESQWVDWSVPKLH